MTVKRFTYVIDNGEPTFYDLSKKGVILNMIDTEEMLNEQDERIKELCQLCNAEHKENVKLIETIHKICIEHNIDANYYLDNIDANYYLGKL